MSEPKIIINSTKVGVIALTCLLAAALIFVGSGSDKDWKVWQGAFTRVGLVMGAFWLALPSRFRDAAWANVSPLTFVGLLLGVIAIARFPKRLIPLAIALLIAWFVLRPRNKGRPRAGLR